MKKENGSVDALQIKCCTTNDGVNHNKCFVFRGEDDEHANC